MKKRYLPNSMLFTLLSFLFLAANPALGADTCDLAADIAGKASQAFEKDMTQGIQLFEKARQLCPDDPVYDYNIGIAYYRYGRLDQAETHLAAAVNKNGENPVWLNNLAGVYLENGAAEKAAKAAGEAVRLSPDYPAAHETLARAKAAGGDLAEAARVIREAGKRWPGEEKITRAYEDILDQYLTYYLTRIKSGDVETGLEGLKKADSEPKAARAYLLSLSSLGRHREALTEAKSAQNRFPGNREITETFDQIMDKAVRELYLEFRQGRGAVAVQKAKILAEGNPGNDPAKKAYDELFEAFIADAASIAVPEPAAPGKTRTGQRTRSEDLLADISGEKNAEDVSIDLKIDVETQIPEGADKKPYSVGVVIGNQRYASNNRGIGDVAYAERDAAVMKHYLEKVLGFDEKNIIFRTNMTSGDFRNIFGSRENPRGMLHNYVRGKTSEVFIYYSGHGAPSADGKKAYLVPVDAQVDYIANNGFPLDLFYETIEKLGVSKVTVVLDACFSGDSAAGPLFSKISPAMLKTASQARDIANAAVFCSADKDQVSTWYPPMRHSMFTYFFLKGLGGDADKNNDKAVTVGEMKNYLAGEVPYMARRESNRVQTPQVTGDPDTVLARLK